MLWRISLGLIVICLSSVALAEPGPIKVGWIGPMTGPLAKYGAYQAAQLAEEDINAVGGINGRKFELVFEDGKGDGRWAAMAAQRLISLEGIRFIVGGHCSPETMAMAPVAERSKVIVLAAITSNPMLTTAGDYIFRVTAVSLKHAEIEVPYAIETLQLKRFAVIYEETDYARPPAEYFADLVKKAGKEVVDFQSYHPGEVDFRAVLTRLRAKKPDGLYLGIQAPDTAVVILRQLRELGINVKIFGNELTGNAVISHPSQSSLFEGIIFAEPPFDLDNAQTKSFVERYKTKFAMDALPYGFWTAEAYDAVRVMAKMIADCGDDVEKVKACLYALRNYPGVSAPVSIDQNGDGLRSYQLKIIKGGKVVPLEASSDSKKK